jgi:uncharacterized protein YceK
MRLHKLFYPLNIVLALLFCPMAGCRWIVTLPTTAPKAAVTTTNQRANQLATGAWSD